MTSTIKMRITICKLTTSTTFQPSIILYASFCAPYTQYTNKKGKTSDMHLVKFNHELSKEEKTAAKAFISEPLTEGRRTPRGWYDRKQGGYMVRSEEVAKQLGNMFTDETAVADAQPLTVQDYRNAASPATRNEQEKKPANTVTVEDAAIQDVEAKVYNPEQKKATLNLTEMSARRTSTMHSKTCAVCWECQTMRGIWVFSSVMMTNLPKSSVRR